MTSIDTIHLVLTGGTFYTIYVEFLFAGCDVPGRGSGRDTASFITLSRAISEPFSARALGKRSPGR